MDCIGHCADAPAEVLTTGNAFYTSYSILPYGLLPVLTTPSVRALTNAHFAPYQQFDARPTTQGALPIMLIHKSVLVP